MLSTILRKLTHNATFKFFCINSKCKMLNHRYKFESQSVHNAVTSNCSQVKSGQYSWHISIFTFYLTTKDRILEPKKQYTPHRLNGGEKTCTKSQAHLIHWSHHTIPHILSPSTHGHEAQELVQLTMMMSRVTYLILLANAGKLHQPKLTQLKLEGGRGGGNFISFYGEWTRNAKIGTRKKFWQRWSTHGYILG